MSEASEDLAGILDWLDEKPTLSRHAGAVRKLESLADAQPDRFRPLRLGVVRNFTIETEEAFLRVAGYRAGLRVDVHYSGYDPGFAAPPGDSDETPLDAILVALRLEELAPDLGSVFLSASGGEATKLAASAVDQVIAQVVTLRDKSRAPIFVHNFVAPVVVAGGLLDTQNPSGELNTVRTSNVELASALAEIDGVYVIDVDHLFASVGYRECLDQRGARSGDAPLSVVALRTLADAHVRHLLALRGPAAKCIVLDADNTLWGGVIGEDGIDGIALGENGAGRRHRDFQQHLLDLKNRGVVLALCSKNEEADVLTVLRDHPDCLLSEDDFAARRINWQDKVENLLELAAELNLGLEHMVFVDDNPVEIDSVKTRLPTIRAVQWPDDVGESGTLDALALFDSLTLTTEDRERSAMYRAEGERARAREAMPSLDEYLRSLEMVATVGEIGREHFARVSQLTLRTNQFNLTTRRYEVSDIERMLESGSVRGVWLALADKFGRHGIVGCGLLTFDGDNATIDTLLMSCRVLGRDAEAVLVNRLAKLARSGGASTVIGEFVPSERNGQVADLYIRLGFEGPDSSQPATWTWDLGQGDPAIRDWFHVIDE